MLLYTLLRHHTLRNEDIHETLQGLHILLRQQVVVHRNSDEMYKATVQLEVSIDVPERVVPVVVVEMSIASEHLLDYALDVLMVMLWEAGRLANPVARYARQRC